MLLPRQAPSQGFSATLSANVVYQGLSSTSRARAAFENGQVSSLEGYMWSEYAGSL